MLQHARRKVFIASAAADDGVAEMLAAGFGASGLPATGFWAAPRGRGREAFLADMVEAPVLILVLWSAASLNSPRIHAVAAMAARESRLFEAILAGGDTPETAEAAARFRARIPVFPDRSGRFDRARRLFTLARSPSGAGASTSNASGNAAGRSEIGHLQAALELFAAAPQIRPCSVVSNPVPISRSRKGPLAAGATLFGLMASILVLQGGPLGAAAYEKLYAAIDLNGTIRGRQRGADADAVPTDPDIAPPETRSWDADLVGLPPEIARAAALARAARDRARQAASEADTIAAVAERIARAADTPEIRKKDNIFRGEVRAGSPAGIGRREFPDGARFWGTERKTGREGPGVFLFADRETFHGEFRDDFPNGYGRYSFADGTRYEGRFAGGSIAGYGILLFPDGRRYEGAFADRFGTPIYQGPGIYWPDKGPPVHGIWLKGVLTRSPAAAPARATKQRQEAP